MEASDLGAGLDGEFERASLWSRRRMSRITQVDNKLLHGAENVVCADGRYTGGEKREEHAGRHVIWQIAFRRSTYKKHGKRSAWYNAIRKIETAKARVRAKAKHPFRIIKRQFGYTKVRFRGLAICNAHGDAVCPVESEDGPPIFVGQRRRGRL